MKNSQRDLTSMDDLPNVIMEEILTRLPTRTCFQCLCVSKRWQELISTANFAHRFLCKPINDKSLHRSKKGDLSLIRGNNPLFQLNDKSLEHLKTLSFPLKFILHPEKRLPIIASCDDFLLCSDTEHNKDDNNRRGSCFRYYIGNPKTRRWAKLPPLEGSWKNHLVGFVLDEKRLVVVHLVIHKDSLATVWKLSSSSLDAEASWSSFPTSYPNILKIPELHSYIISHNHHLTSLNGTLYLVAQKGILGFNPISDSWSFVPYGFKVVSHYDSFRVGSCDGVLCLSQLNASYKYSYFRLWELREDCNNNKGNMNKKNKKDKNDNKNKKVWYLKRDVKFDRVCTCTDGESCWGSKLNFQLDFGDKAYLRWNSFAAICNFTLGRVHLVAKNKVNYSIGYSKTRSWRHWSASEIDSID